MTRYITTVEIETIDKTRMDAWEKIEEALEKLVKKDGIVATNILQVKARKD